MNRDEVTFIILILGGIGGWTSAIVICTIWLTSQFRKLEKVIYQEVGQLDHKVDQHGRRLDRLEIHSFGFNFSGLGSPPRPEDS